jgi:putative ABC transport system permease protein
MKAVTDRLADAYPKDNLNWGAQLTALHAWLVRDFRMPLLVLMAAVSFLLLIACANVAGLIMARTSARRREIQVRLALGAGRWRLVRQFLVEGVLLSALGVAAGLAAARWAADALFGLLPSGNALSSVQSDISINLTVLLFAVLVSTASSIVFALISVAAIKVRPPQRPAQHRFHKALVVAQFACAIVLVTGAGLLIQSFVRMLHVDPGYDPRGLALMYLPQPAQNRPAFNARVLDEIKATPGIESAAFMSYSSFGGLNVPFNIEGQPLADGDALIRYSSVSAAYFRTLKTRLISGREFTDTDSPNAPGVAIINETLARRYFRGENPIGKKIIIAPLNQRTVREIVGVVRDVRQEAPDEAVQSEVYVHWPQLPWLAPVLLMRGADSAGAIKAAQNVVRSIDRNLPPMDPQPVEELLGQQVAEPRLYSILLGIFAGVALILALLGNYGLLSYIVNRRMHDMAIRMAIGARRSHVMRLVATEGLWLAIFGAAIGLIAALGLTGLMKSLLFGVTPTDPMTLLGSIALMLAFALLACYIPARRATGADPVTALRHE